MRQTVAAPALPDCTLIPPALPERGPGPGPAWGRA
jgi:hypothetical protein